MATLKGRARTCIVLALTIAAVALPCQLRAQILYTDQEIEVRNLPVLVARTQDPMDVLLTSLDTVFHDRNICCGKDSALEDSAQAADPESLKDVAAKIQGRQLLGDGRPILVEASFATPNTLSSGTLVAWMQNQRAALMQWKSHLYVVHGIVYAWVPTGSPGEGASMQTVVKRLLLWDTRFSDARREVVFDREIDDLQKIQGLLFVQFSPK